MKVLRLVLLLFVLMMGSGIIRAQNAPQGVVEAFLNAWNELDYARMHTYLHPRSQELYPAPVFEARLQVAAQAIALSGLSFSIRSTELQGISAAVTYDVVFDSGSFGTIEDAGRLMRLMETQNGWRIAWSSMDIFEGLAGDSQIRAESRQPVRATIYDRNGAPIAWDNGTTTAIYGSQQNMNGVDDCFELLSEINLDSINILQQRFSGVDTATVVWITAMPTEVYAANSARLEETCGVVQGSNLVFESDPHRQYYGGKAMAHVLGYVGQVPQDRLQEYIAQGFVETDTVGLEGVELSFNRELAGQSERVLRIIEPGGTVIRELAGSSGAQPVPIQLTIDRDLQLITAQALSDAFNYAAGNWGSPSISFGGAAVVLDVKTGEILALASYPLYDPQIFNPQANAYESRGILVDQTISDSRRPLRNNAISEQESPGSIFKIITAAAILNEGLIAPDEIFTCDLIWEGQAYGDTRAERQDWRVVDGMDAAGEITPAQAIMSSCNPFFWQYGAILYNQVGPSTIPQYARRMGLSRTYGLQSGFIEASGSVETTAGVDLAINEAVGQGSVTVSPLHMAVMTAGVANDGILYEPYLIRQVGGFDGAAVQLTNQPTPLEPMNFNDGVIEAIKEGMCGVTTNKDLGTAYIRFGDPTEEFATLANYTICGKTGTAQTLRYPNAWFIAYTPADDPQLAIAVMVEQSLEGSQVSAPITRRILDDYLGEPRAAFPPWWNNETYLPLDVPEGGGYG